MVDLKKEIEGKTYITGSKSTLKNLKIGKIKKVYIAKNCPEDISGDIKHYSKLNKCEVVELDENNEEIGILCKKPFPISILGIQ